MLSDLLKKRFSDEVVVPDALERNETLQRIAGRGSCRAFRNEPVPQDTLATLAAVALSAPTKSDLQQRDIILVTDQDVRAALDATMTDQPWIKDAPTLLIFCGNNRRQRQLHEMRGHKFANDHLDAFFNASIDAGVALATFVVAAEAAGLGCCPISAIRNAPREVSDALRLPQHVFPVAGIGVGFPANPAPISMRLSTKSTVHLNSFDDSSILRDIKIYDDLRAQSQPYARQRHSDRFGHADQYPWSEDKARQYAEPERADFGKFIKRKGFVLD